MLAGLFASLLEEHGIQDQGCSELKKKKQVCWGGVSVCHCSAHFSAYDDVSNCFYDYVVREDSQTQLLYRCVYQSSSSFLTGFTLPLTTEVIMNFFFF